ncbi:MULTISPECIES: glycosyltransferase [unclassified Haematospirillum]|uniref:glycosyltransferase n=1 Tax=unclassified Haematospirillum TaxID=2622088 RepID=UPI00143BA5D6|nr:MULTISPECIES: glycosyltransferase [unclassified Haematospirillum]NKD56042.1 glycosyltransferase [Haematospirillum sp. H4890]NKD76045.1 glycosyltransferase [Haematospirillum sp. H4485]NKD88715.1 glycosyltransferase [Haematospirillum sp. 15-248]
MSINVAHVMRTYGIHGGESQLAQLFSSFSEPGFQHFFFFVYRDEVCQGHFSAIPQLQTETLLDLRSKVFPSLRREMLALLFLLPILQVRLILALRRNQCRICVAHGVQGAMVAWLAATFLRKVRFVYVHRGTKSAQGKNPLFKLLYRPFDVIAGVSRASADSLRDLAPGKKLIAIENGIDWQAIEAELGQCPTVARSDRFVIVCVGRLLPAKGQSLILEAFADVQTKVPGAELFVIGTGPDAAILQRRAEQLGISDTVRFLGDRKDVVCLLGQSNVFVHASESEGLSNAVLEAMAVGLPSIVLAAPGVTECHVEAETAFVISRSHAELSACLLLLAVDPFLCKRMGQAARARVREHYSIAENCKRYAALYYQLISLQN